MPLREILALERAAFAAWPAAEWVAAGDWRLRHTFGVTRRANSAFTAGDPGEPLGAAIERVEAFYRARGADALFQVTPASPPGLDAALADRGYAIEAPVSIQLRPAAGLASALPRADAVRCEPSCFDEWFEVSAHRGRFREVAEIYRGILERLESRALYFLGRAQGVPAAVALAVLEPPWAGVFSMLTLPEHRRQGLGRALLGEIARVGSGRGVERLYLQVERDNAAALSLYRGAGFRERYAYHYRRGLAGVCSGKSK